jgi:hypothetical protein
MSGMDVVTRFDEKFRCILTRDFQAKPTSLTKQIQDLKSRLPVTLVKQLVKIDTICRKVQGDPDQTHSRDLADFVTLCLEAEEALENFRFEEIRREEEQQRKEEEARQRAEERQAEEKRRKEMEEARRRMQEAKEARRQEKIRQERESYHKRVETSLHELQQLAEDQLHDAELQHAERLKQWQSSPDWKAAWQRQQSLVERILSGEASSLYRRLLEEDAMARYNFFCQCWQCGYRFESAGRLRRDLTCPGCGSPCPALT